MILHPVKASNWVKEDLTETERAILKRSGIVPVNDILLPYWDFKSKVLMFYGGRGGGKSQFVVQKLIKECISTPYFKCFYGRKTFESVRESCFDTIVSEIEAMGLKSEFSYSRADHSTMVVKHIPTGNRFIPFGCDKPEKLKSIKDPSHVWCEEFVGGKDEFSFKDFGDLLPTLRTQKCDSQLLLTLNTEGVNLGHWFIKVFFNDIYRGDEVSDEDISKLDNLTVTKVMVNYVDNYFINHDEYRSQLWLSSGGNKRLFDSKANGAWGVNENNHPWLYAFNFEKHVRIDVRVKEDRKVYLSFDFNNDPVACTAWQFSDNMGGDASYITCVAEFVGVYKIEELCQRIKTAFPHSIFHITGDRSGRNKDLGRNETLYDIIARLLGVRDRLVDTPTHNISHNDSRILCNTIFEHYPHLSISHTCTNLLNDCEVARVVDKNNNNGGLEKDRKEYKMDAFDSMRYFFQTYFLDYISNKFKIYE